MELLCSVINERTIQCGEKIFVVDEVRYKPNAYMFWIYVLIIIVLLTSAAIFSGLSMGLLSLDKISLKIMANTGSKKQQEQIKKIQKLLKDELLLMLTLIISDNCVNLALPIVINKIANDTVAWILSVSLVVLVTDIIPQSLFRKHTLKIGSMFYYPVLVLIAINYPIAYPLSKFLSKIAGVDPMKLFKRDELVQLLDLHSDEEGTLKKCESNILGEILKAKKKEIKNYMKPINNMVRIPSFDSKDCRIPLEIAKQKNEKYLLIYDPVTGFDKENCISLITNKFIFNKIKNNEYVSCNDLKKTHLDTIQHDCSIYDFKKFYSIKGDIEQVFIVLNDDKNPIGFIEKKIILCELGRLCADPLLIYNNMTKNYNLNFQKVVKKD